MATLEPNMINMTKEERQDYRAQLAAANAITIKRLRTYGRRLKSATSYGYIVEIVQEVTGRAQGTRSALEYLTAFLAGKLDHGEVAPAREAAPFKPLTLPTDLQRNFERAARDQPPMMTPNGTGNHNEYTKFMLNNGRSR